MRRAKYDSPEAGGGRRINRPRESFDLCLRDFLDRFFAGPSATLLAPEPLRLSERLCLGDVEDAYLAATAEWLAWRFNLQPPAWSFDEQQALRRPWFASDLSSLRAVLLLEKVVSSRLGAIKPRIEELVCRCRIRLNGKREEF